MNSGAGQGPPGQANNQPVGGQARPAPQQQPMYRPEMMRNITLLTEEEKGKYEKGLAQLWKTYETSAPGSAEKAEAQKKIIQFGSMLANKVAQRKQSLQQQQAQRTQQQAQNAQQGQQGLPGAQGTPRMQPQQAQLGQQSAGQPVQQASAQRPMGQQTQGMQNMPQQQTAQVGAPQSVLAGAVGNAGSGTPSTPTVANMSTNSGAAAGMAQGATTKLPPQYLQLVQELNVAVPNGIPDKAKWLSELKQRYARALVQMDLARTNMQKVDQHIKDREEKGVPLSEDEKKTLKERKETLVKQFQDARTFIEGVRSQQQKPQQNAAASPANVAGGVGKPPARLGPQSQPQVQPPSQATVPGAGGPVAKQQVPQTAAPPNNPMQNPTAAVNAAFEQAKNQQIAAARVQGVNGGIQPGPQGSQPVHQAQVSPTGPTQTQQAPISQTPLSQPATAQQQQPPIKIEPGTQSHPIPTPLNTAIASNVAGMPSAGTPTQNSAMRIQTPQSATPTGAGIRPLSHAAAVSLASQIPRPGSTVGPINTVNTGTPSSAQGVMGTAPQQQAQGHPHGHPTQQGAPAVPSKLPIPKTLPDRAMQIPAPVAPTGGIGTGRPTFTGGSGVGGGVMNQPALAKTPAYTLEGEGERVLNKKKLDELVRQVCGGTAEGQEGNLLAPEVEEVSFSSTMRFSTVGYVVFLTNLYLETY